MEKFNQEATSGTKASENAHSSKQFTAKITKITGDNVADYSDKQIAKIDPDSMDVWVKPEIHLFEDEDEQSDMEDSSIDNVNANDYGDDAENSTSNIFTDQNITTVDPLSEFAIPDIPGVSETSKISLLEKQLELSNARNLELEKIVHQQKYEIEMLRQKQQSCGYCSKGLIKVKKKTDNPEIQKDQAFDENATICPVCKKDLTTIKRKQDRIRHLRACRDGSKFQCPYCILTYTRKHDLMKHFKKCAIKK